MDSPTDYAMDWVNRLRPVEVRAIEYLAISRAELLGAGRRYAASLAVCRERDLLESVWWVLAAARREEGLRAVLEAVDDRWGEVAVTAEVAQDDHLRSAACQEPDAWWATSDKNLQK
jgi:hypothetical protein